MTTRVCLPPPPPLHLLQQGARAALFLDFDGTLVEIARGPDAIMPPPGLAQRLEALAALLGGACAIVSGRGCANLARYLGPVRLTIAGSHGAHIIAADGTRLRDAMPLPPDASEALRAFALAHDLLFEAKPHGAALHFRTAPEKARIAESFTTALAERHGLATKTGKCVIELVQPGASKGGAVGLLCRTDPFVGAVPIFIGDDVTDEDGFAACNALAGFGIAVGERPSEAARYHLDGVDAVWRWLGL